MYISQVTFEVINSNEEVLKNIMSHKVESARSADGVVSVECWKRQNDEKIAYSLVIHWQTQEAFTTWMKNEHNPANREKRPQNEKVELTKSGAQYEVVEL